MKKKLWALLLCLGVFVSLAACGGGGPSDADKVVFGDAGWDSMKFHNAVAMLIAESAYDLKTEEISGSTAVTYGAVKTGDITVYMETWTDNIATYAKDVEDGLVTELGVNYDDNIQGLYVPRYVVEGDPARGIEPMAPGLKTVEDLKDCAGLFKDPDNPSKGRLYGSISGWAADTVLRNKFAHYGLDAWYNYVDPGSDAALSASIAAAYEKGDPILAYYWEPAWLTGQYDLLLLEDAPYDEALFAEGACAFPAVRLTVCVNPDFAEKNPEFCTFLSRYATSSALTSEALSYINQNDASYRDAAVWFLKQHDELLDEWLDAEKAALTRAALG